MSMEKQEQKEIAAMVESTLMRFNYAIKSQEELNLQMSRRISRIILFGVLTVILLSTGIGFLT